MYKTWQKIQSIASVLIISTVYKYRRYRPGGQFKWHSGPSLRSNGDIDAQFWFYRKAKNRRIKIKCGTAEFIWSCLIIQILEIFFLIRIEKCSTLCMPVRRSVVYFLIDIWILTHLWIYINTTCRNTFTDSSPSCVLIPA